MDVVSLGNLNEKEFKQQCEAYFKQYFKRLCFRAMSFVKDDEVARDIVHDVFLSLWNHRSTIDTSQPIYPYLLRLTRNCALDNLSHLKVVSRHEEQQVKSNSWIVEPNYDEHEELIQAIMQKINDLPDRCGEVMRLCFVECKKYKEIAELLNISVNTVKIHISMVLKMLRDEFPASILFLLLSRAKNF